MKKMFSKSTAIILAMAILFGCVRFSPNIRANAAAEGTCGANLTWTLDDEGTLTISGEGAMTDYENSNSQFFENEKIKNVVIDYGVTSIGNSAFEKCGELTSVTIPDSVTSIGSSSFRVCQKLQEVVIPKSVVSIDMDAFSSCDNLSKITISDGVTSIGFSAFEYCDSLTSVTIPSSVTSIGGSAFSRCNGLTEINVSEQNKYYCDIDGVVFSKDKKTILIYPNAKGAEYIIPDHVTTIGGGAFQHCNNLTNVTIPDSVTSISFNAFVACKKLTDVAIPDSVTSIEYSAFFACDELTSITIPDGVTLIGSGAFSWCDKLTAINVGEQNKYYCDIDGVLFSKDKKTILTYPKGKGTEYTIPDHVTSIDGDAFRYCDKFTNITIPDSVTSIDDCAFNGCDKMTDVYYTGSESQWNDIKIGYANSSLINAIIHFNACLYHSYDEGKITTEPTCTAKGVKTFTCADCGATRTEEITALGHDCSTGWIIDKKPTLTEQGSKSHHCSRCDSKIDVTEMSISRLSGSSRNDTAIAISNKGWEKAETVVLANSMNYADALAGVPYAYKLDAPILLTAGKATLEPEVLAQIQKLSPKKIVILGGKGVISNEIKAELEKKYTVERVSGTDRYLTAVEISKRVNSAPETAIIVTGTGYADALSISPYAALKQFPIVYSNPTTALTDETLEYLKSAKNILIIGGPGAVGENTVKQLEGKSIERLRGSDRYLTSYAIVDKFQSEFSNDVMLATGVNFPDALAGGVLAAKLKTPLLLTHPSGVNNEIKNYILDKSPENIYILGGKGIMPDSIVENIF